MWTVSKYRPRPEVARCALFKISDAVLSHIPTLPFFGFRYSLTSSLCEASNKSHSLFAMGLFGEKSKTSPNSSLDNSQYPQYYPDTNGYSGGNADRYGDDLEVECPPHTTERKLVRRIDLHVVPFLCILYLLAFLDRVNIANANVYGMSTELALTGNKYNVALVIFFAPCMFDSTPLRHYSRY